jgi:hypothetical protein
MAQITTEMVAGSVAAVLAPNHDASTSIEKVDRGGTYQFSCHDRDMKIVICEKANFGVRDGGWPVWNVALLSNGGWTGVATFFVPRIERRSLEEFRAVF